VKPYSRWSDKSIWPWWFPGVVLPASLQFFQANNICSAIWSFLQGDAMLDGLCGTTIVLIPKISKPEQSAFISGRLIIDR